MNQFRNPTLNRILQGMTSNRPTEQRKTAKELVDAIGNSHDVLVRVQTVFPFKLFPTIISVDRTKVTITERDMFKSGEVFSVRIEDILNITAHVNPILGSVKIATRFFNPEKPYIVDSLSRKDALKIKRIVQGYLIARQREIDCSSLPTRELATMLDELGKVAPQERV
jgi:hypothetical protein